MLRKHIARIRDYNEIAGIGEIARRYFAMNSFDGILTILGVLLGNYFANVQDPRIIVSTGISTSVAMAISGIWGTYFSEESERKKKLKSLERAVLMDLDHSQIGRAEKFAIYIVALVNGLSPFLSAILILIPFLIGFEIKVAYSIAMAITFVLLLGLGAFLGHVSEENMVKSAIKMLVSGLICVLLLFLINA